MTKRFSVGVGFSVVLILAVLYVLGYMDRETFRSESPDGAVHIIFRKHADPFGGVLRVSSSGKVGNNDLYTIENDSCPAPSDLKVVWSNDSMTAAIVPCDAGCGRDGSRLYDVASGQVRALSESRLASLVIDREKITAEVGATRVRENPIGWVCR